MKRVVDWCSSRTADVLWVAACFVLTGSIAWQGWKEFMTYDDILEMSKPATEFLRGGLVPSRSCLSTYCSFIPPGGVWLFVPGVLLTSDYRLFELAGSLLLNAGTLIGLFILVNLAFSGQAARLAVLLYAVSPIGLLFAGSLWPRGHPFFCVWFVIFTILWHRRGSTRYLAAALVTLAAGMYVFLELAPLLLLLPAVWCLYRPPLRARWILVAASVSLIIWFPYLRFERTRNFLDIASLVFQTNVMPQNSARFICDSALRNQVLRENAEPLNQPRGSLLSPLGSWARERPRALWTGLLGNFTLFGAPGGGEVPPTLRAPLLLFLTLLALVHLAPNWLMANNSVPNERRRRSATLLLTAAAVLFVGVFAVHPTSIPNSWLRHEVLWGMAAMAALSAGVLQWGRSQPRPPSTSTEVILVLALLLPWTAILLITKEALQRRYLFLWPLQTALLAYLFTTLLVSWGGRGWLLRGAQIAIIVIMMANSTVFDKLIDWRANGWEGTDSDALRALEFVAHQVHREGRDHAAIGYLFHDHTFNILYSGVDISDAQYHATDPSYKVGMGYDYVLAQRFGVRNSDQCAEGFSGADNYLLLEADPDPRSPEYVRLRERPNAGFRELARFGDVVVVRP